MAEHDTTPRPWVASTVTFSKETWADLWHGGEYNVVRRGENIIALIYCADDLEGEERANAELIVRAVNEYDELRRALALARSMILSGEAMSPPAATRINGALGLETR